MFKYFETIIFLLLSFNTSYLQAQNTPLQLERLNLVEQAMEKPSYWWLIPVVAFLFLLIIAILYWNRKLANEIKLRKLTENQIQTVIDSIPLQIIVTAINGDLLSANTNALSQYQIKGVDLHKLNILNFFAEKEDAEKIYQEITETGKVSQKVIPFIQPDGSHRSMLLSITPITFKQRHALLAIAVDVTKRIEFESALQIAKDNAESANRSKSEFLANMSHEIRTPMNAILGFTELLKEQIKEPKHNEFICTIQSAGKNLLALINDILDLSKIEAGKINLLKTNCDIHTLLIKVIDIFSLKIIDKGIELILDVDPKIPSNLILYEERLRQVLLNLVGNAIKFTEKGSVSISVKVDNHKNTKDLKTNLIINIKDTGIGISENQKNNVFNAFEQSSEQDIKKYGGTGLGLSISQKLVGMMQGEITLISKEGEGSTFSIKLPNIEIANKIDEPVTLFNNDTNSDDFLFLSGKILIVDDNTDNRNLLLAYLADKNLKLIEAENGEQAVKLSKEHDFDIILMDIRMPIMDGYQAARQIKKFTNIPIIAITASVMTSDFNRIKANDFQGYVRKPFLKKEILSELVKFLPIKNIIPDKTPKKSNDLNPEELANLPKLLKNLKDKIPQCQAILKSNKITDIKIFSEEISEIATKLPLKSFTKYTLNLSNSINSFNIESIRESLQEFTHLINRFDNMNK